MRERTFRIPTVRELLERQRIDLPDRINDYNKFLLDLMDRGRIVSPEHTYKEVVKTVEDLEEGQLALLPSRFRVPAEESNYGLKSLSDLVKIDSKDAMREVAGQEDVPNRLTRDFLEGHRVWPHYLRRAALEGCDIENPPTGIYWIGTDDRTRVSTFIRETTGAEMEVMRKNGDFSGEVLDRVPYPRSLRVRVSSRTEEGKEYEYTLSVLPMHEKDDPRMFSDWINIFHNSNDPDASYKGLGHEQRTHSPVVWSSSTIFGFYEAMSYVREHSDWTQFRANPFAIPNEQMIDFIDNLRLRTIILDRDGEDLKGKVLNKSEMDKIIGARTILREYDNCWYHWKGGDKSYLYNPDD